MYKNSGDRAGRGQAKSILFYIAGYGRSGSTVLDALLGNHPRLFGAGELSHVFSEMVKGGRCSCGSVYLQCTFWREVLDLFRKRVPGLKLDSVRDVTRNVERFPQFPSMGGAKTRTAYTEIWTGMIDALRAVSGKDGIVDSSKSARMCWHRIRSLVKFCGTEVRVIHLVRDPRAVTWSFLRGSNRKLERGKRESPMGGVYRAVFGWALANLSVHRMESELPGLKVKRVRYEDLVKYPARELKGLESLSAIDMEPILDIARGIRTVETGHGVGGNRLRRRGPFQIKEDDEWKRALSFTTRKMVLVFSWPLARKYGYTVLAGY